MAKVAARGPLPSNTHHFDGVGGGVSNVTTAIKRKTPSELRGEQLKRKNTVELVDESPAPVPMKNTNGVISGIKKSDVLSKNPRYVDTRLDEVFPVKKNSIKLKLLSTKENVKENISADHVGSLKSFSVPSALTAVNQPQTERPEDPLASTSVTRDNMGKEPCSTSEKGGEGIFRSVTELSLGGGKPSEMTNVDMDKAFKGLVQEPQIISSSTNDSFERTNDSTSRKFCSQFHISDRKIPLDVTLKTTMRVVSSSTVNRFHRSIACSTFSDINKYKAQAGSAGDQNLATSALSIIKSIHSWVYPQSSLPPSVILALASAATEGEQMDFLSKRQFAWEDSFRSLYYMLRTNVCKIFYVCTAQFVVMFTGPDTLKEGKVGCNAYISQSTRSLRSLLKEHDICFSMPLSRSKVEQVNTEDLAELSEIERQNLGQTRRLVSLSDGDNSPQSLLAFKGNESVHGLYDFLLNYKFVLTSMAGADVPLLYSPVPFENAALSAPEVRCKEVRRADNMVSLRENNMLGENGSASGFCYSMEIKDSYLPPWIIASVCNCLDSDGSSYEISFSTEPTSIGLNVGLRTLLQTYDPEAMDEETCQGTNLTLGVQNTIFSPKLDSAFLKGLKYSNSAYDVSLSPV